MHEEAAELNQPGSAFTDPIQALVHVGKEKFAHDFPGEHHCFDAVIWDISRLRDRPATQHYARLSFTCYGNKDQALPHHYAEVVKSWIILERHSLGNLTQKMSAIRLLWEALLLRQGNDPTAFHWQDLCEEDLSQAEILMLEHVREVTVYTLGNQLLGLVNFLAARQICRQLYYVLQTPRPDDFSRHTIAGQEARKAKLPSKRTLEGIADIYSTHAKNPADRLCVCALAILAVTEFRLGELLTLPLECEVTDVSAGKARYGLRYYKEKARGGRKNA